MISLLNRRLAAMATTTLLLIATTSSIAAGTPTPPPNPGDDCTSCGRSGTTPAGNELWATANRVRAGSNGGGTYVIPTGSSYLAGCTFTLIPAGEEVSLHPIAGANNQSWDVDYWVVFCPPQVTAYTFYPDGGEPPAPVVDDMIQDAYARTPVVAFDPITSPDGDDDIPLVTQLLTFLWVDDAAWNTPVEAVASIPGFSVTATATPNIATWSGGEDSVTCTGDQMVEYQFGIGGDDAQPSDCTTVFKQSSAIANHELELAATWTAEYSCSGGVCGGPLPDIITTSIRPVTVAEIQAVATNSQNP